MIVTSCRTTCGLLHEKERLKMCVFCISVVVGGGGAGSMTSESKHIRGLLVKQVIYEAKDADNLGTTPARRTQIWALLQQG